MSLPVRVRPLALAIAALVLVAPAAAAAEPLGDASFAGSVYLAAAGATLDVKLGTRADASQWDGSQWDGSQWDASQWDGSQWDGSQWDGSQWDASQWDASQWDASQWDSFEGYDPFYPYQWNLRATNVPAAWGLVGPGDYARTICILDSGVDYTHPDLAPQMWRDPATGAHGYDFVDDDNDPMDAGGHGTHVASIAAAQSGDEYGIAGVANARIMAVRVIGPNGYGSDEDFAQGIRWCVDHGAHIVSMSLSTIEPVKLVASAANYAVAMGALVVSSAGNTHCKACQAPLVKIKGLLTVTAMAPDGTVAPFATWGPNVDLGAPGVAIPGAMPGGRFAIASGSSQAVPLVSGIAALVWERNQTLTAGDVVDVLLASAMTTGEGPHGPLRVVDAEAALHFAAQRQVREYVALDPHKPQVGVDPTQAARHAQPLLHNRGGEGLPPSDPRGAAAGLAREAGEAVDDGGAARYAREKLAKVPSPPKVPVPLGEPTTPSPASAPKPPDTSAVGQAWAKLLSLFR